MWIKIKEWKYIGYYFTYMTVWGLAFVITLILTNMRVYEITGTSFVLLFTVLMVIHTAVFEVTGLMISAIAVGLLLNVINLNENKLD